MTSTLPPLVQAFSGAIGSASANALSYPFNLVTTKLQLDSPRRSKDRGGLVGGIHLLKKIHRKYGLNALYDGLGADTIATLLSSFFYFYIYSFLRFLSTKRLIPFLDSKSKTNKLHKPSLLEELFLGFIAGVASRAVATPLNVITLRMQTERANDEDDDGDDELEAEEAKYQGIIEIVKLIYKEQGLAGFWRGFQMSILLSFNPSITMAVVQIFRRTLGALKPTPVVSSQLAHHSHVNLHAWEAFFGGAIANSIAVTILYPLILGKKRLQASSKSTTIPEVLVDAYLGKDLDFQQRKGSIDHGKFPERSDKVIGGLQGLYQGYQLKIVSNFLSQGVSFMVKNRIEKLVIAAYLWRLKRGILKEQPSAYSVLILFFGNDVIRKLY